MGIGIGGWHSRHGGQQERRALRGALARYPSPAALWGYRGIGGGRVSGALAPFTRHRCAYSPIMQGGGARNADALCPPWLRLPPIPIPISARYPLPMLSCCLLHPFSPSLLRTSPIAHPLMAAWGLAPIVAVAPCPHGSAYPIIISALGACPHRCPCPLPTWGCISYHYIRFGGLPPSSPPPPAPSFICIPLGIGRKP